MVQVQHGENHITRSKEMVFVHASAQARRKEIEQNTFILLEDSIVGEFSRLEAITWQINPKKKSELEVMAQVIVSKALDEPQHCKACVSLSGALHMVLPALPSAHEGKKGETFMHALLDVFQTEFEDVFMDPSHNLSDQSRIHPPVGSPLVGPRNRSRIRAIAHFAGQLYRHGLVGKGVVNHMVHDLVDNGEAEAANELLWFINLVTSPQVPHVAHRAELKSLGTVLEDVGESDGTSSQAVSNSDRRPSVS